MPQMKPMNWLNLFIMFLLILIFNILLNYYMTMYNKKKIFKKKNNKNLNWKW